MKSEGYRCQGSHYGRPHGKDRHVERAKRAAERAELRKSRTPEQQLRELDRRGAVAKKERARLAASGVTR
jgi:hypothetical protein